MIIWIILFYSLYGNKITLYLISCNFWLVLQGVDLVPAQDDLGVGGVPPDFDWSLTRCLERTRAEEEEKQQAVQSTHNPESAQHEGDFSLSLHHSTVQSSQWQKYVVGVGQPHIGQINPPPTRRWRTIQNWPCSTYSCIHITKKKSLIQFISWVFVSLLANTVT